MFIYIVSSIFSYENPVKIKDFLKIHNLNCGYTCKQAVFRHITVPVIQYTGIKLQVVILHDAKGCSPSSSDKLCTAFRVYLLKNTDYS